MSDLFKPSLRFSILLLAERSKGGEVTLRRRSAAPKSPGGDYERIVTACFFSRSSSFLFLFSSDTVPLDTESSPCTQLCSPLS